MLVAFARDVSTTGRRLTTLIYIAFRILSIFPRIGLDDQCQRKTGEASISTSYGL